MGIYAYVGIEELGSERLGTFGRVVWRPEENMNCSKARVFMSNRYPGKSFTIYTFTNFYDDSTFQKQYTYYGKDGLSPGLL